MSLFIRKVIVYLLVNLLAAFLLLALISWGHQKRINWVLPNKIEIVILGNSHTECGIDDRDLNRTINLSRSAHSFFENFYKLKYLTAKNPIKRIILEVGHTDLTMEAEKKWILSEPILKGGIRNYFGMSSIKELIELGQYASYSSVLTSYFSSSPYGAFKTFSSSEKYSSFGSYRYLDRNRDIDSLYTLLKKDSSVNRSELANYNLIMLDRIVKHCINNEIELIFITSPVHKYYLDLFQDINLDSVLSVRYPQIEHLDYTSYDLDKNGYGDLGHLNYLGAKDFTSKLKTDCVIE